MPVRKTKKSYKFKYGSHGSEKSIDRLGSTDNHKKDQKLIYLTHFLFKEYVFVDDASSLLPLLLRPANLVVVILMLAT
jgi:hypothetical protein